MNKRVFFGQNDIRFFYFRYKDSKYYSLSIFFLIIIVCVILFINFLTPQFNKYLSIRQEVIDKRERIRIINENINFMNNLDKSKLNTQLKTATRALPAEKDFYGILNALSDSSIRSGATLSDFSFNVGEIASKSADTTDKKTPSDNTIAVTVSVKGNIERIRLFLKLINENLPLSEVISVGNERSNNLTTINLKFYYKQYPEITFKADSSINPLAEEKIRLIEKLALWQRSSAKDIVIPVGTSSAAPLFE